MNDAKQDSVDPKKITIWRINVFTAAWFSYVGYYFCRKAFGVLKPAMKDSFHFSDTDLAWIWTAYLTAYMLGQFLSARLGRRFACRLLLLIGMAGTLLCNIVFGFAVVHGPSLFYVMVVFMIVNGFCQATGWPGNVGLLAKWSVPSERGRLMGVWGTCYQLGSSFAKHFAAFMLAWLGVSWSFWGASIVMLFIWTLFYFLGKEEPESVGLPPMIEEIKIDPDDKNGPAFSAVRPWNEALRIIIAMGTVYFCFKFIRYAMDSWSTTILWETFHIKKSSAGHISTLFDWVGFLGVVIAGFASDTIFKGLRTPVIFIMTVGMFCSCLGIWYFVGGPTPKAKMLQGSAKRAAGVQKVPGKRKAITGSKKKKKTVAGKKASASNKQKKSSPTASAKAKSAPIVWTRKLILFVIFLSMMGFMLMGPDSILSGTAAMDVCDKKMAVVASGIINGLGSVGPILQELIIAYLKKSYGISAIFVLLVFVSMLGIIGTGLLWWSTHRSGRVL